MFAKTKIFDSTFLNISNMDRRDGTIVKIKESLREIVEDNLRKGFCPATKIHRLRGLLSKFNYRMTCGELDVDDLISTLFEMALRLDPFILYSIGTGNFLHQLFVIPVPKPNPGSAIDVQTCLEQSMRSQGLQLSQVPRPAFFIKMPRSDAKLIGFHHIIPNLILNVSSIMRPDYSPTDQNWESKELHLLAIICLASRHYTTFVREGHEISSPWFYFNSMPPSVTEVPGLGDELFQLFLNFNMDHCNVLDRDMSKNVRRILSEIHLCIYEPRVQENKNVRTISGGQLDDMDSECPMRAKRSRHSHPSENYPDSNVYTNILNVVRTKICDPFLDFLTKSNYIWPHSEGGTKSEYPPIQTRETGQSGQQPAVNKNESINWARSEEGTNFENVTNPTCLHSSSNSPCPQQSDKGRTNRGRLPGGPSTVEYGCIQSVSGENFSKVQVSKKDFDEIGIDPLAVTDLNSTEKNSQVVDYSVSDNRSKGGSGDWILINHLDSQDTTMVRDCLKGTKRNSNSSSASKVQKDKDIEPCPCLVQSLIFVLVHTKTLEPFCSTTCDTSENAISVMLKTATEEIGMQAAEKLPYNYLIEIGLQIRQILKDFDPNAIKELDTLISILFGKFLGLDPFLHYMDVKIKSTFFHPVEVDTGLTGKPKEKYQSLQRLFLDSIKKNGQFTQIPHPALIIKIPRFCGRPKIVPNLTLDATSSAQAGAMAINFNLHAVICRSSNSHYTVFLRVNTFDWLYFNSKENDGKIVEELDQEFWNGLCGLEKFACTHGMEGLSDKVHHLVSDIYMAIYLPKDRPQQSDYKITLEI